MWSLNHLVPWCENCCANDLGADLVRPYTHFCGSVVAGKGLLHCIRSCSDGLYAYKSGCGRRSDWFGEHRKKAGESALKQVALWDHWLNNTLTVLLCRSLIRLKSWHTDSDCMVLLLLLLLFGWLVHSLLVPWSESYWAYRFRSYSSTSLCTHLLVWSWKARASFAVYCYVQITCMHTRNGSGRRSDYLVNTERKAGGSGAGASRTV